ncbi:MAG: hemolysin family protein, partial [Acidimicrobiales bacterium]
LLAGKFLSWPASLAIVALNICVVFVVTEAVPRTLGIIRSDRVALALAGPVLVVVRFPPIRLLARALIWITNIVVPGRGLRQGPFAFPEELIALADAAVEDAVLDVDERDLIESVIEFGDTIVREVMVPRTDMTTIALDVTVADALEVTSAAGFSRVPALGENVDDVVGLVYVKDLIKAELDDRAGHQVASMLRPSRFVPETKRVSELLKEMQQEKFHMAIAVDEYGGIAGLVTLEDLIEELVGEIVDEYDVEEPLVERQRDGSLRVDARISIDELNALGAMDLPEGDWDTVAGLVFDRFGRVPTAGDTVDVNGYSLRVERLQGRRITRVRIVRAESTTLDPVAEEAR